MLAKGSVWIVRGDSTNILGSMNTLVLILVLVPLLVAPPAARTLILSLLGSGILLRGTLVGINFVTVTSNEAFSRTTALLETLAA